MYVYSDIDMQFIVCHQQHFTRIKILDFQFLTPVDRSWMKFKTKYLLFNQRSIVLSVNIKYIHVVNNPVIKPCLWSLIEF